MSLTDSRNNVTVPISWGGKTGEQFFLYRKNCTGGNGGGSRAGSLGGAQQLTGGGGG